MSHTEHDLKIRELAAVNAALKETNDDLTKTLLSFDKEYQSLFDQLWAAQRQAEEFKLLAAEMVAAILADSVDQTKLEAWKEALPGGAHAGTQ